MTTDTIAQGMAVQAKAAAATTRKRLQWWARSYQGVQPRYPAISSPPTITIGGANATVNANTNYTTSKTWNGGAITLAGPLSYISDGASPSRAIAQVTTLSDSSVTQGPVQHARFLFDGPAFEVPFKGLTGQVNVIVDGQYALRSRGVALPNDGSPHQLKVNFGSNVATYALAIVAKVAGGSGYVVGDTITLAGGTATTAAVLTVTQVSSGAVAAAEVTNGGAYSVASTSAGGLTQASTSGAGTGATFTGSTWSKNNTVRGYRRIELIWNAGSGALPFPGVNIGATDNLLPWPVSPRVPRLVVLGDSQQNTYLEYAGGGMAATIAQRLGLWDNLVVTQQGGTGYLTDNGTALHWTDSRRIADIVAQQPDVVLIIGGQNDVGQNSAALTAAVTAMLNSLLASLPNTLFVGIGPVVGNSATVNSAIAAGWLAASDQARVRYIDNITTPWVSGTGRALSETGSGNADFMVANDNAHLHQSGVDVWAGLAASAVGDALLQMISPTGL